VFYKRSLIKLRFWAPVETKPEQFPLQMLIDALAWHGTDSPAFISWSLLGALPIALSHRIRDLAKEDG
jgi:hypothetical protein